MRLLSLRGITKAFPGVLANDHIDLDVHGGEVHAVVGENGAGKSTLVKILYGFYRADAGEIRLDGRPVQIRAPSDARRLRIGMVFQELVQIPALTVAENVALFLPDLPVILDRAAIARRIAETSARYGLDVDPAAPIWRLSVGERQRVEIVKLLLADARVLILDEPTRGLAPHEIDSLLAIFTSLRRDGYAVVFITHKLREVLAGADRITVLRRGVVAGSLARADATEAALVALMFGDSPMNEPARRAGSAPRPDTQPILELLHVSARPEGRETGLAGIDLSIRPHEIVGVAGVAGNGQRELGDVILGLEPCAVGAKYLDGQDATRWSVRKMRAHGVIFIPEDALGMAAVGGMTVLENMALGDTARYARRGGLSVDWSAARGDLDRSLGRLGVSVPSVDTPIGALSGGNVQRVILAREMARDPRLIVAFYPTRGLDVRSATAARELLVRAARDGGAGVLLISEDLGELFSLSDRVVVLFRGRIAGAGSPGELTVEEAGYLMTGAGRPAHA
jgi:simple sugar transport system ATP-binding protein